MADIDDVKREVAIANRILSHVGLATGVLVSLGHASFRVPSDPGLFIVKGRGYAIDALPLMQPDGHDRLRPRGPEGGRTPQRHPVL